MGKQKLRNSNLHLKLFDRNIIKVMGSFERTLETKKYFWNDSDDGGSEVLKVDITKFINSKKAENNKRFKYYRVSICLKKNHHPSYVKSRKLPILILPMVAAKKNNDTTRDSRKAPQGSSNWSSLIVAIRKLDGDSRICGNDKKRVCHQICLDSFPLPNIETASHELAIMKYFAKTDLKSAYSQMKIGKKFKEIIIINTPIGLTRRELGSEKK